MKKKKQQHITNGIREEEKKQHDLFSVLFQRF